MTSGRNLIILFTKYPSRGEVKTRLIPSLGVDGATSLHAEMTKYVFAWLKKSAKSTGAELEVWFDGGSEEEMELFLGAGESYKRQGDGDLGEKMHRAFESAFAKNNERVIIVGSDCPTVRTETINQALELLQNRDVVLGPAFDGGYYLIGMSRICHDLFSEIPWGTNKVFEMTRSKIEKAGLFLGLLPRMSDVDTEDDLHIFEEAKKILP